MTIQSTVISIKDPGIRRARDTRNIGLLIGTATAGSTTAIQTYSNPNDVITEYTSGPLAEAGVKALTNGGRPVRMLRLASTVGDVIGSVTQTGTGGAATVTGDAVDTFSVKIEVTKAGGTGVGRIKYTLDNWLPDTHAPTYADEIIVAGAPIEFTAAGSGLTVSFDADLVLGTTYEFTTEAPHYTATEIAAAFTLMNAYALPYRLIAFLGDAVDIATANTDAAAIATGMAGLLALGKYKLAMTSVSRDTTTNIIATWSLENIRIAPIYGRDYMTAGVPMAGRTFIAPSCVLGGAVDAMAALISTDLSRYASGPAPDVVGSSYDSYLGDAGLDDARISTRRTWENEDGVRWTDVYMASANDSDFKYWQHALVMAIACEIIRDGTRKYSSASLRSKADGTLDAGEIADIDTDINALLAATLLKQRNAEGELGHVSSVTWATDPNYDAVANEAISGDLSMRPLLYPKTINATLGFSLEG